MDITVVYDNRTDRADLQPDWGFSCVVESDYTTMLFDTGTHPQILAHNMDALGFAMTDIDRVMLSHEHYDHTGGLEPVVQSNAGIEVIIPVSFSDQFKQGVEADGGRIVEISEEQQLADGIATTGPVGHAIVEQAMVLLTADGPLVITGCAHPGVVEMVRAGQRVYDEPVEYVLGGFHLNSAPRREVLEAIQELQDLGVAYAGPCHCTGDAAIAEFRDAYGENFLPVEVGWRGSFEMSAGGDG